MTITVRDRVHTPPRRDTPSPVLVTDRAGQHEAALILYGLRGTPTPITGACT